MSARAHILRIALVAAVAALGACSKDPLSPERTGDPTGDPPALGICSGSGMGRQDSGQAMVAKPRQIDEMWMVHRSLVVRPEAHPCKE